MRLESPELHFGYRARNSCATSSIRRAAEMGISIMVEHLPRVPADYPMRVSEQSLYEILMVDARADAGIIALVYHALAKRYHSDRTDMADAPGRMARINAAYAVLSDADRRAEYDRSIGLSPRHSLLSEPVAISIRPDMHPGATGRVPMVAAEEFGEVGVPPPYPLPSGSVLGFGRYKGWALNQVDAYDPNFIEWLQRTPTGRMYASEIEAILRGRVSA